MPGPQCGITLLAFNCGIMHRMQVLVYLPCMLVRVRFQIGVRADFEGYMYYEGVVNVPAYSEKLKKNGYIDQFQPPLLMLENICSTCAHVPACCVQVQVPKNNAAERCRC